MQKIMTNVPDLNPDIFKEQKCRWIYGATKCTGNQEFANDQCLLPVLNLFLERYLHLNINVTSGTHFTMTVYYRWFRVSKSTRSFFFYHHHSADFQINRDTLYVSELILKFNSTWVYSSWRLAQCYAQKYPANQIPQLFQEVS